MADTSKNTFLGRGWSFPPQFDEHTMGLRMSENDDDIREGLYILLSTLPGERLMFPEYGCDLHGQVFQTITNATKTVIRDLIITAIVRYEPRVTVLDIQIDDSDQMSGRLDIHIEYEVIGINSRKNMVYPFYLVEGTDL